jgi:hypothetical protein
VYSPYEEGIRESLLTNLTDATAYEVARYVVQKMDREADQDTLEYDFQVTGGEMVVDPALAERNTWFKFDTAKDTLLNDVKRAMYEAECTTDELQHIERWNQKVCRFVEGVFTDDVCRILRREMFRNQPVPMKLMRATNFEIIDFSSLPPEDNLAIYIEKDVPQSVFEDYGAGQVSHELFQIHAETGKGFNQIIREKKAEGDPDYQYVKAAHTRKMLWECQIDFLVNYFAKTDAEEQALEGLSGPGPEAPEDAA